MVGLESLFIVRVLLQTGVPESQGVQIPVLPLVVAVATLFFVAAVVTAAFLKPAAATVRTRRKEPVRRRDVVVKPPPAPAAAPLFKKAPVRLTFPQIREGFPDVWGVGQAFECQVWLTDKAMAGRAKPSGLTVKVAGEPVDVTFARGVATVKRTFDRVGEVPFTVDLRVPEEQLPQRTTRAVRIVEYRKEIAEVFHKFREEASRVITPVREDATPREVLDILVSAKPNLPEDTLWRIIQAFEIAKFSNHPVGRDSYEQMIEALLDLERVEL